MSQNNPPRRADPNLQKLPPIHELIEWCQQDNGYPRTFIRGLLPLQSFCGYDEDKDAVSGGQQRWASQRMIQREIVAKTIALGMGMTPEGLRELRRLAYMARGYADSGLSTSPGEAKRLGELILKIFSHHDTLKDQANEIHRPYDPIPRRKDHNETPEETPKTTIPPKTCGGKPKPGK